jgi:DeoR/GlpR family transcriptional regulator of sugar metabolism
MVLATQEKLGQRFMHQAIASHEIDYLVTSQELTKDQLDKVNEHHIRYFY